MVIRFWCILIAFRWTLSCNDRQKEYAWIILLNFNSHATCVASFLVATVTVMIMMIIDDKRMIRLNGFKGRIIPFSVFGKRKNWRQKRYKQLGENETMINTHASTPSPRTWYDKQRDTFAASSYWLVLLRIGWFGGWKMIPNCYFCS